MSRLRRVLSALALSSLSLVLPASTYAGGGVGGGGVSGLVIMVDHMTPAGHNYGFLDYFPRMAYIHQGDVITFRWATGTNEPHTVSLLPRGVAPTNATINRYFPAGNNPAPDTDDANKSPVQLLSGNQPRGWGDSQYFPGTAPCIWNGTTPLNSGVMGPQVTPRGPFAEMQWVVRFNGAPGTYHWMCLIHGGGMNGTVQVLPQGASMPTFAQQMASATGQYQTGASNAMAHEMQMASHLPPPVTKGGHTTWNILAGDQYGRVAINEFLPRNLSVRPGDSVNWLPGGFHTATSMNYPLPALAVSCEAPGANDAAYRGNLAVCPGLEFGFGPGMFANAKSGAAWTGQPLNSGNFVIPQPHSFAVSFPKATSFQYHCLIHPHMVASITIR